MAALIISTSPQYTFGAMTNRMVGALMSVSANMNRLNEAIATASSGYTGVEGTQFEVPSATMGGVTSSNLFGVVASATPGEQGANYRYAVDQLHTAWLTFWAQAEAFVEQLDNGQMSM
jgi:hypothetical protein